MTAPKPERRWLFLALLLAALAATLLASLYTGRAHFDPRFLPLRWHRTQAAFFAGAGLAVGGVVLQGLFRNPLASPSILGTTAGAAFGGQLALVAIYAAWGGRVPFGVPSELAMPLGCVLGALATLAIVLGLSPLRASAVALLLSGFLLSALFSSLSTLLESLVQEDWQLSRALHVLSAGSLSGAGPRQSALVALLSCGSLLPAWAWARELDVLQSGEDEARSLGVDVRRARLWLIVWSAFLTAGAVAVGAHVTFVGLIVPHVVRRFVGHAHRALIPAAFVGGGAFLLACDVLCRLTPLRNEIPLGAVTALIGGPLFLRLLVRLETEGST